MVGGASTSKLNKTTRTRLQSRVYTVSVPVRSGSTDSRESWKGCYTLWKCDRGGRSSLSGRRRVPTRRDVSGRVSGNDKCPPGSSCMVHVSRIPTLRSVVTTGIITSSVVPYPPRYGGVLGAVTHGREGRGPLLSNNHYSLTWVS